MSNFERDLGRQMRALKQLHREIKAICETVGIDVQAAERDAATTLPSMGFDQDEILDLPWHDSVAPESCLARARDGIARAGQMIEEQGSLCFPTLANFGGFGLVGIAAVMQDASCCPAAKAALLKVESVTLEMRTIGGRSATLCWLVHDVLAFEALHSTRLPEQCSEIIDLFWEDLGKNLAADAIRAATSSVEELPSKEQIEAVLFRLAQEKSTIAPRITELLENFNSALLWEAQRNGTSFRAPLSLCIRSEMEKLYPELASLPSRDDDFYEDLSVPPIEE